MQLKGVNPREAKKNKKSQGSTKIPIKTKPLKVMDNFSKTDEISAERAELTIELAQEGKISTSIFSSALVNSQSQNENIQPGQTTASQGDIAGSLPVCLPLEKTNQVGQAGNPPPQYQKSPRAADDSRSNDEGNPHTPPLDRSSVRSRSPHTDLTPTDRPFLSATRDLAERAGRSVRPREPNDEEMEEEMTRAIERGIREFAAQRERTLVLWLDPRYDREHTVEDLAGSIAEVLNSPPQRVIQAIERDTRVKSKIKISITFTTDEIKDSLLNRSLSILGRARKFVPDTPRPEPRKRGFLPNFPAHSPEVLLQACCVEAGIQLKQLYPLEIRNTKIRRGGWVIWATKDSPEPETVELGGELYQVLWRNKKKTEQPKKTNQDHSNNQPTTDNPNQIQKQNPVESSHRTGAQVHSNDQADTHEARAGAGHAEPPTQKEHEFEEVKSKSAKKRERRKERERKRDEEHAKMTTARTEEQPIRKEKDPKAPVVCNKDSEIECLRADEIMFVGFPNKIDDDNALKWLRNPTVSKNMENYQITKYRGQSAIRARYKAVNHVADLCRTLLDEEKTLKYTSKYGVHPIDGYSVLGSISLRYTLMDLEDFIDDHT